MLNNPEEINLFVDNFIIEHPFFFNHFEVFNELEKLIGNSIINAKNRIHIWVYPSYSGEEVYSIAIFFEELKKKYNINLDFKIVASTFNKLAKEKALKGMYRELDICKTPKDFLKEYFNKVRTIKETEKSFKINEKIINKVEFREEGIIFGHALSIKYDFIFCRNFLVYITKNSQKRLLSMFNNNSSDGTLLILGMADQIQGNNTHFEPIDGIKKILRKSEGSIVKVLAKNLGTRDDRITIPTKNDELLIKTAHYGIVYSDKGPSKMSIYGLGSCIALILYDNSHGIHGMSHILLPDSNRSKSYTPMSTPHKYIDTSIKELLQELINHGAVRDNIKAIVIGGASVIDVEDYPILNNAEVVKEELHKFGIEIEKSDLGGKKGRSIIYNAKSGSVLIKKDRDNKFRIL